jgi:hypothetical protein
VATNISEELSFTIQKTKVQTESPDSNHLSQESQSSDRNSNQTSASVQSDKDVQVKDGVKYLHERFMNEGSTEMHTRILCYHMTNRKGT